MRIGRNVAASITQIVVSSLIMFFLYRYILDVLGVESLGVWSVVMATASIARIGELGLSASVTRFVAKYRALAVDQEVSNSIQTALVSIAALFLLLLYPGYVFLEILFEKLFVGEALEDSLTLLPYALGSLVFSTLAGIILSGLDGCQRYDWRAFLSIAGQLIYFILVLILALPYGLVGIALAQILQSIVLLVFGWILLRQFIDAAPILPYMWRYSSFREMLGYGIQYQLGSVAMMLFDPLTKVLLGKYAGLTSVGYYEMANQFITKVRALAVSANQVIVPVVAEINEKEPVRIEALYRQNIRILVVTVIPIFSLAASWAPLISEIWLGKYETQFVYFVSVLALAWCVNTLCVPAYFFNQGRGQLIWNTSGLMIQGMINASLGYLLGSYYGAIGIVWAALVALVAGGAIFVAGFHRDQHLDLKSVVPRESLLLVTIALLLIVPAHYGFNFMLDRPLSYRYIVSIILPFIILAPLVWCHPLRVIVHRRISNNSDFGKAFRDEA